MSALPVACRNAPASAPVWWQGPGAWQVTLYGLEGGSYAISAGRLADVDAATGLLRWPLEMAAVGAADLEGFLAAFPVALALHNHGTVDLEMLERSVKAAGKQMRRAAYEAKMRAAEVNKLRKMQEKARRKLAKPTIH